MVRHLNQLALGRVPYRVLKASTSPGEARSRLDFEHAFRGAAEVVRLGVCAEVQLAKPG